MSTAQDEWWRWPLENWGVEHKHTHEIECKHKMEQPMNHKAPSSSMTLI